MLPLTCLDARAADQGFVLGPTQTAAQLALARLGEAGRDGVYLHGPPGRGKTWLLDGVVACAGEAVRRLHWTDLFTRLDAELGRRLTAPDRLPRSIDALLGDCRVLCFDELDVTDPDDAGLVEHLLLRLAERRTLLVVTSNAAPDALLRDSLHRHWADGLVRRLQERFVVCHVDDGVDYRTLGAGSRFARGRVVPAGTATGPLLRREVVSGGRVLPVRQGEGDVLWADFRALLSSPTGRQDYLALCRAGSGLGLSDVPDLDRVDGDTRQRFVVLVDVAHDTDTPLTLAVAGPLSLSCLPPRTASRLALLASSAPA